MATFDLVSKYQPTGDQPEAIKKLSDNVNDGVYAQTLLGATGTGKTRTAIGCMLTLLPKLSNYLIIVATPQNTLSRQWKADISSLRFAISFLFRASHVIAAGVALGNNRERFSSWVLSIQ